MQLKEPYHIQGIFARRQNLSGSAIQMVKSASAQAEAQYGIAPTVCLLSGWDYQGCVEESFMPEDAPAKIEGPVMLAGIRLVPVYSLLPGHCVVGWPEGEAPEPIRTAAAVREISPSEQVLSHFQSLLKRHKGRGFPLARGSAPWRRELAIAKKLVKQCGDLAQALRVIEVYFTSEVTSWQNPLSLAYILKVAPSLLSALREEEARHVEMQRQAAKSQAELATVRLATL